MLSRLSLRGQLALAAALPVVVTAAGLWALQAFGGAATLEVASGLAVALGLAIAAAIGGFWGERLQRSLRAVGHAARGLAAGELTQRARSEALSLSDAGQLARNFNMLADRLSSWARQVTLLNQMGTLLPASRSEAEAMQILARSLPAVFAGEEGSLYLGRGAQGTLDSVASWPAAAAREALPKHACWALRCGGVHVGGEREVARCDHVAPGIRGHLCIPIVIQGETSGLLHLGTAEAAFDEVTRRIAEAAVGVIGAAIANLRLRKLLLEEAAHDPLTKVLNRRSMERALRRELGRASRDADGLSLLMLDLDNFKVCNDIGGHQAGDQMLARVAQMLVGGCRPWDLVCRYGGDEFVIILPATPAEVAVERGETLRRRIADARLETAGHGRARATISIGVATFPEHGSSPRSLIDAADAALKRAKDGGRDRVVLAREPGEHAGGPASPVVPRDAAERPPAS